MTAATGPTPCGAQRSGIPATLAGLAVPIGNLSPYPGNPRRDDVAAIVESLRVNGQYRPVVANRRNGQVLAGNHTLLAARQLGWPELAVSWVDVDDDAAVRIVAVDNRASDLAGYDDAELVALLGSLPDLAGTGYDDDALADLLAGLPAGDAVGLTDVDDAPDRPDVAVSRPGDLWLLGEHRLVVGDATRADVWAALLPDGETVDAVWTDPPYGVDYVGKTADELTISGDSRDQDTLGGLLTGVFTLALERCEPGAAWYVAAPAGPATLAFASVLAELGVWRQTLVWVKDRFVLGHSDYHYRHELLYMGYGPPGAGRRGRGGAGWYGPNNADTVLEVPRPARSAEHPTMKPVELVTMCLDNSTVAGQLVADPFAGSGSTLIACHHTGRIGRLVERDRRYADVVCRRWQRHTGVPPVLASTGDPVDFVADEVTVPA